MTELSDGADIKVKNEDLILSSAFIEDATKRADVRILYAFFEMLREIPERVTQPLMGEIRLRWWYEAIEEIVRGDAVRYHPLSAALEDLFARYALDGQAFLDVIEGQMVLLDKRPLTHKEALTLVDKSEVMLAHIAARIIDPRADATILTEPLRYYGVAYLHAGHMISGPEPVFKVLRDEAQTSMKRLPSSLMPLAAHAALARDYAARKTVGPLSRRFKVLSGFLTGSV